ncbi:PVC-type heme-binding CxxCH protein [Rubinisphaera margarita]|uniref:PVC-type heme-binding CxxCH protein n=1 Tax=Rubinisphaera margarita TaxID=2909586 RepID=UPI001EE9ABAF|nr:PVC-type heme-binding CxxCH protein [Rubinisphaera margarita]MCG6158194.1 c-type cytochrome [Rubinisphaera margarita]
MIRISLVVLLMLASHAGLALAEEARPWASKEKTRFTPTVHHPNIKTVTLFAENPDIVTPVGIAVAPDGRVFVQENHTHKRTSDYQGPETDRILVFEDSDGDGVADKRSIFYEGHTFSTDLLFGPDGHLYVSTRWFIGRFRDAATKSKADGEPEKLVVCETEGDYPHNGVGGLAIDPAHPDWLAFGFGENLGVDYAFVGSDGVRLSGGGEGGSTYRCRTDGTQLERLSTGHWNAFGMAYDLAGNLYSTDNDPNATPPNRLLHIIPGADFGYEYRYGRSGQHPLVCWFGENPGTLGMCGALGEAACGVIAHGPEKLLTASWTDNRVDLHTLKPNGASFQATREPFLTGPDDFRPVHFSYSNDGRYLYFTDWVKISYPVHGHGRIWRIEFKEPVRLDPEFPRETPARPSPQQALKLLGSDDPYVRTQAMHVLTRHPDVLSGFDWQSVECPLVRSHAAVTLKRIDPIQNAAVVPDLLADEASAVRFVGIKWIADADLKQYRSTLEQLLDRSDLTRRDLRAIIAALASIGGEAGREFFPDDQLAEIAVDASRSPRLRGLALQSVNSSSGRLQVGTLYSLSREQDELLRREAIRLLVIHPDPGRAKRLAEVAADESLDDSLRADAIAGLAPFAEQHQSILNELAASSSEVIASEASRTLSTAESQQRKLEPKPELSDLPAWKKLVWEADGSPNPEVGRRLFFHAKLGNCFSCHAMNGRGHDIGPDLSTIRNQTGVSSDWLLKHIVNPSAEMAPYYRPQQLITVDGKVRIGLIVGREGQKQAYVGPDGQIFLLDKNDIEERRELTTSVMPNGLLDRLSPEEIRDLLAYLLEGDEN